MVVQDVFNALEMKLDSFVVVLFTLGLARPLLSHTGLAAAGHHGRNAVLCGLVSTRSEVGNVVVYVPMLV